MKKIFVQIPAFVSAVLLLCSCASDGLGSYKTKVSDAQKFELRLTHPTMLPSNVNAPQNEWPAGYELVVFEKPVKNGKCEKIPLYVKKQTELCGKIIKAANVVFEHGDVPAVEIKCTPDGAEKLQALTAKIAEENKKTNSKQMLAALVDGKIVGTIAVCSPMKDGFTINGNFTMTKALKLAQKLTPQK